jgi:hypothetical protein
MNPSNKKTNNGQIPFNPEFQKVLWELYHCTIQVHRLFILHDLLQRYKISMS